MFSTLYRNKLFKYILLYLLLLMLVLPMYFQTYHMAKQLTLNAFEIKLSEGLNQLETQMQRANEISVLLTKEDTFRSLLLLEGSPSSKDYQDFKNLQVKLSHWALTTNLINDAYILFRKNPLLLTNALTTDNYLSVYPKDLQYQELSAEEWRRLMLDNVRAAKLLPEAAIFSSYRFPTHYTGIPWVVNSSFGTMDNPNSVLVFIFDKKKVLDALLIPASQNVCAISLSDAAGKTVLEQRAENFDDSEKFVVLKSTSMSGLIQADLKIPESYFQKNVQSLINIIIIYLMVGIIVLLFSIIYMTYAETKRARLMVESASRYSGLSYKAKNEYAFVSRAMDTLYATSEKRLEQMNHLTLSMRWAALENILLFGILSNKISAADNAYFNNLFRQFCIVKIDIISTCSEKVLLEADAVLSRFAGESVSRIIDANQLICVLPLQGEYTMDELSECMLHFVERMKLEYTSYVKVGISSEMQDMSNAHEAYQQARDAVNMNAEQTEYGIFLYRSNSGEETKIFTPTAQMQLYDAMIAGDEMVITRIFSGLSCGDTGRKGEMLFYSLLLTVDNAVCELLSQQLLTDREELPTLPRFNDKKQWEFILSELQDFCTHVCALRNDKKRHKNSKHTEQIFAYIHANYRNPGLSADSMAKDLQLSPATIFSVVRDECGKSLSRYIEHVRLSKAEELLLTTNLLVGQIWEDCGFGSEKTFYRTFSKKHSVTPSVWKSNQKNPEK